MFHLLRPRGPLVLGALAMAGLLCGCVAYPDYGYYNGGYYDGGPYYSGAVVAYGGGGGWHRGYWGWHRDWR